MLDLRAANQHRFSRAKQLWTCANGCRVAVFLIGAVAVFQPAPPRYLPQVLFLLAVAAELLHWRSDVIKGQCDSLLRKLDLCSSFDMEISEADRRDIVTDLPPKIRKRFSGSAVPDTYFTSSTPASPAKAVENLVESAWYTRRQASMMTRVCVVLICLMVTLAVVGLMGTSNEVGSAATRVNVSKVVTGWLLLIFSLGMVRHGLAYYQLAVRSERTYTTGLHLLKGDITAPDAIKQWYEYQIGRASSPLLPDLLWKMMQKNLNDGWARASAR